ncbi:MAG: prolyl oligopeptidase family serine peptidase [Actinomycetaceae bacterium]|nr:prolyl oligopeptidase family serine peptidase [Actinomycetaceae bacterium]
MTSTSTPQRQPAPFGAWEAELTADVLTHKTLVLSQVRVHGTDTYWVESRSLDGGRNVLLRMSGDGQTNEVLPMTADAELVDVRSRVHEYGGKAYGLAEGVIVVSHGGDNCLYRFDVDAPTGGLTRLTPQINDRYSDMTIDTARGLVYCIREDHDADGEPRNSLVAVPLDASGAREVEAIAELWADSDFVAAPALSHDGRYLAFVTWSHPHMPWQKAELRVARLDEAGRVERVHVLVDAEGVAAQQPRWSDADDLIHVDDSNGWANLYRTEGFEKDRWWEGLRTRALHPSQRAFSSPAWQLGLHSFDVLDADHLVAAWCLQGQWHLGTIRLDNGQLEEWPSGWAPSGNVASSGGRTVMLADHPRAFESVVEIKEGRTRVLRSCADLDVAGHDVSVAEPMRWTSEDGAEINGFFYAPMSRRHCGMDGELPPLITIAHGGPTSAARTGLRPAIQYWTTRGFAVLDVNYRGSTGYGRAYRDALDGYWGIRDVADCASGARYLAEAGYVDGTRMAIRGASAGGFTALSAAARTDTFSCCVSHYGVADLARIAGDTHKFESRYVYRLLGADSPADPVFRERSPLELVETIDVPVLLLQGEDDPIVPPSQTRAIADALRSRGVDVEVHTFPGESHGFRTWEAKKKALLSELAFYRRVWAIPQPDRA